MIRAAAALVPLMVLALAAPVAPAHAGDAKVDLGDAFTRTCFAPGKTMAERRDALLQRGADLMPKEDPDDPAELFMILEEGMATVFVVGPSSCTVASRNASIADARRQFPAVVRAVAGDDVSRLRSYASIEPVEDGEFLDVYEHRDARGLVRYTLMLTRNPKAPPTVFMVVEESANEFIPKEKRW